MWYRIIASSSPTHTQKTPKRHIVCIKTSPQIIVCSTNSGLLPLGLLPWLCSDLLPTPPTCWLRPDPGRSSLINVPSALHYNNLYAPRRAAQLPRQPFILFSIHIRYLRSLRLGRKNSENLYSKTFCGTV